MRRLCLSYENFICSFILKSKCIFGQENNWYQEHWVTGSHKLMRTSEPELDLLSMWVKATQRYWFLMFYLWLPYTPLACVLRCLYAMDYSDLPLVRHLLTSWWSAWRLSYSRSRTYTCISIGGAWNLGISCVKFSLKCSYLVVIKTFLFMNYSKHIQNDSWTHKHLKHVKHVQRANVVVEIYERMSSGTTIASEIACGCQGRVPHRGSSLLYCNHVRAVHEITHLNPERMKVNW